MATDLKDILNKKPANSPPAAPPPAAEPPTPAPSPAPAAVAETAEHEAILSLIEGVEVEAVVGGALQRIRFGAGANPALVGPMLKALDPNALVRDAFPARGNFGNRETKTARCLVINARVMDNGAFIDLVSQNGEDLSVAVSKKNSASFASDVSALNKLSEKNLAKLHKAFDEKGSATIILSEPEQFGVQYWTTDDGKHFMDSLVAEPPAAAPEKEEGSSNDATS